MRVAVAAVIAQVEISDEKNRVMAEKCNIMVNQWRWLVIGRMCSHTFPAILRDCRRVCTQQRPCGSDRGWKEKRKRCREAIYKDRLKVVEWPGHFFFNTILLIEIQYHTLQFMMIFQFTRCSFRSEDKLSFIRHTFESHASEVNFQHTCGINGCPRTFSRYSSFLSHANKTTSQLEATMGWKRT